MSAKKKPKRPQRKSSYASRGAEQKIEIAPPPSLASGAKRWPMVLLFVVVMFGGVYLQRWLRPVPDVPYYTFKVVNTFSHDTSSFTQGLLLKDGIVWESTGKYGKSKLRKIELETGNVLKETKLPDEFFGEGLARRGDLFYQLTWKAGKCLVYDLELNKVKEFDFKGQGWGLAYNPGTDEFVMSDGSSRLQFMKGETFELLRTISVRQGHRSFPYLNELEYNNGSIYANQLYADTICKINSTTGAVEGIFDLAGLWPSSKRTDKESVLNGIAFDGKKGRLIVTGKFCPSVFEIEFEEIQ